MHDEARVICVPKDKALTTIENVDVKCDSCGADLVMSRESLRLAKTVKAFCEPCAVRDFGMEKALVSPEGEELLRAHGIDPKTVAGTPIVEMASSQPGTTNGTWSILDPRRGSCPVCAEDHVPGVPHNPQSLFWITVRHMEGKPAPSWNDAMQDCSQEVRDAWTLALAEHDIYDLDAPVGLG